VSPSNAMTVLFSKSQRQLHKHSEKVSIYELSVIHDNLKRFGTHFSIFCGSSVENNYSYAGIENRVSSKEGMDRCY